MKNTIKAICVVLGALFLMSVSGCGKKPDETKTSKTENGVQVTTSSESAADTSEAPSSGVDEDFNNFTRVTVVELDEMYINYNKKLHANNFSHGFFYEDFTVKKSERICIPILVTYDEEVFGKPFAGELKDIFDVYNNGDIFRVAARATGRGPLNTKDDVLIELDSSDNMNINGIDAIHFTGHASNNMTGDELRKFYVTGYSFIFNGRPYMLVGVIFGEQEGDNMRESMDKEIDCMMKTVRSERNKEGITND